MNPADHAALDFGRMWMRAVDAEVKAATLAQQLAEAQARLKEFENGTEHAPESPVEAAT